VGRGKRLARQASIGRAKREWESTADALDSLVCLLSPAGRICRVNRVIEDWSLGTVSGVLGRPAHEVLHPGCADPHCRLARYFRTSLRSIAAGRRSRAHLQLTIEDRIRDFRVHPLRAVRDSVSARSVLVVTDVTALHEARGALEQLNAGLEARVQRRTRALRTLNGELRAEIGRRRAAQAALRSSGRELAALSAQLLRAQESERKRIALELHDSVGQSLSAVKYTIERALGMIRRSQAGEVEAALALSVRRIQEAAEAIRAISTNLRPRVLDDLGAASALQWFCRQFAETYPGIRVKLSVAVDDRTVPERLATVVFRSLQELLNNVAKHARARTVWVSLYRAGGTLVLQVRDDGVGPPQRRGRRAPGGSGLRNLLERAQLSGGTFRFGPAPDAPGAQAEVAWPLEPAGRRRRTAPAAHAPGPE
jgi:signal transduction histidine kinase